MIEKNTYLNQIRITFHDDGTYRGADRMDMVVITEDGNVISRKQQNAVSLDPTTVSDVLGETNANLLAQIDALTTERDTLQAELDPIKQERDNLVAERDNLQAQVDSLTTENDSLRSDKVALQDRVLELEMQLPPETPTEISMDRAIRGLLHEGYITPVEAENWASGKSLPVLVEDIIATMDEVTAAEARIKAYKQDTIARDSQLLWAATSAHNPEATDEEKNAMLDAFFAKWAK